jgi:hypothetical protein
MQGIIKLGLAVSLVTLLLAGCSTHASYPAPSTYIVHRVMPGETLACIARWYAGSESQWSAILRDNPGLNPRNLQEQDVVRVSTAIATRHTQQPRFSLASRCAQVPQPPRRTPVPPTTATPTVEIFGPK